jgi:2-polyprenyl-3-methyl-5-hydroxy-6-metoxy-1,4-benzoquinol methylase
MDLKSANDETRAAWDANAEVWDNRMGDDGNDFVNLLQWPALQRLMNIAGWMEAGAPPVSVVDIACGNGLFARRLAPLGAQVVACDFSTELLERAARRTPGSLSSKVTYRVVDVTDEAALLDGLAPDAPFDFALCNMALFDIADIEPIFRALPQLLKPAGAFVFSLTHPCFNTASSVHVAEEIDDEGQIKTVYSIKQSRYMTPYQARGLALFNQPKPQLYFERPLQYYLNLGFDNGFVLDGFEERAFPAGHPQNNPLVWGGNFSELPPVLVARMGLAKGGAP